MKSFQGGNEKTTAFVLPSRMEPVKPLKVGMSPAVSWKMRRHEDAKMWVNHALNKIEGRAVHSLEEFQYEYEYGFWGLIGTSHGAGNFDTCITMTEAFGQSSIGPREPIASRCNITVNIITFKSLFSSMSLSSTIS